MSNLNELRPIQALSPFKRFCCTIGNLPSSYVESMSYMELVYWLCDYLKNTVIPAVNNNANAVLELQNLYVELKNYVDNYFDTVDFEEKVSEKLNEMALDGTLANIINQEIFGELNSKINNVLQINKNKIVSSLFAEYLLPNDYINYKSMQSGCITDNYIVVGVIPNDENTQNTLLIVIDKETMQVVNLITPYIFHHCDAMCFANGYLYINDTLVKKIYSIAESELIQNSIQFANVIDYTANISGICYNSDNNSFYGASGNYLYKLNNNFEIIETYTVDNTNSDNSVVQGISYIDGKIIITKVNMPTTTIITNYINKTIITDITGNILLNYENSMNVQGECEWAQYFNNGLVLECKYTQNSTGRSVDIRFYLTNYFENYSSNKFTDFSNSLVNQENLNTNQTLNFYCDKTATNIEVDGTENKPFHDLQHLINFILNLSSNNTIRIYLKGNYENQTIIINNNKKNIIITSIDENKPTIGNIIVYNNQFEFENLILKRIDANNSNITLKGCTISNENSTGVFLFNSLLILKDISSISNCYNGINAINSSISCLEHKIVEYLSNNTNDITMVNSSLYTLPSQYISINMDKLSKIDGVLYIEENTDLNNIKNLGVFTTNALSTQQIADLLNLPQDFVAQQFYIENKWVGNLHLQQTLTCYTDFAQYKRLCVNNVWSNWVVI